MTTSSRVTSFLPDPFEDSAWSKWDGKDSEDVGPFRVYTGTSGGGVWIRIN